MSPLHTLAVHFTVNLSLALLSIACGGNAVVSSGSDTGDAGSADDADAGLVDVSEEIDAAVAEGGDTSDGDPDSDTSSCENGCWRQTSDGPIDNSIWYPASAWTGSVAIVCGGYLHEEGIDENVDEGERYDPLTDTWSPIADGPLGMRQPTSVWTGEQLFELRVSFLYDPNTDTWSETPDPTTWDEPGARGVWLDDHAVLWGKEDASGACGKVFDVTTAKWTEISPVDKEYCRENALVLAADGRMLVWGGTKDGDLLLRSGGLFDPKTGQWSAMSLNGAPSSRQEALGVWTGEEVIVWGGHAGTPYYGLGDGAIYNPEADTWRPMAELDGDIFGWGTAVWGDERMYVWLGRSRDVFGGVYNPATNSWIVMNPDGAAATFEGATAVWMETELLIWGGGGGAAHGWIYHPPPK